MSDIRFRPVRGKESIIKDQVIVDGNIYFATDSGKIFIDAQGQRNLMGGSGTSVLYTEANSIIEKPDGTFVIPTNTLVDQGYLPRAEDLIINSDGRFFKVQRADENSIVAYLLAVSGSGSGGGSTPGGPSDDGKSIDVIWHDVKKSFIAGTPYYIEFTATSQIDKYLTVEYRVQTETAVVENKTVEITSGQRASIEVGAKMSTVGANAVYFTITGANSHPYTQSFKNIKAIEFKIEQDNENFNNYQSYDSTFNYYVNIYGSISKTLYVTVDDKELPPISVAGEKTGYPISINCGSLGLAPGVHTIEAYLRADGLPSNIITTQFIYHPIGAIDTTYIIIADYPKTCYTYETPKIKYWIYNTLLPITNTINCYINGELTKTVYEPQLIGSSAGLEWNVGMLLTGINTLTIMCNGISNTIQIETIYSDIFNVITDSAVLLLDANGRTNSTSLEKRLEWSNNGINAILKDFNWYNNGWCEDENGRTCLRISNGASIEIPLQLFTNTQPSTGGYTVEFEFKPYNLYSYDLLAASTEVEGEDEKVTVKRTYNPEKAIIKYLQGTGETAYGFCCGTQDAYCRLSDGTSVSARYCDDEIITVAFSINAAKEQIFIYINGIMSGMTGYVRAAGEMPTGANKIYINSEYCDIDLYNIKVYSGKALSSAEIVQNYIANKKDLTIYNQNKLSTGTSVELADIIEYNTNNPDNTTIPYAIITTKAPDILPYVKVEDDKNALIVDIEFVNPSLDYKFNMGQIEDEEEYLHKAPSFKATNVIFNVQGTSSQKYPRKNFKAKFKNSTITYTNDKISDTNKISTNHKLYLDSDIGEKAFTWKADYMDSSGCHNTGFTSYVKLLYDNHPLDYYENKTGYYKDIYRTTIYGFPMLVFHKKSNGSVEFIGKYNFNLDKGCDDTLGFTHDGVNKILNKPYEEVAECWEFGNNDPGRCSFRGAAFDDGYDYATKTGKLNLSSDLEVRYHKNADAIENAFKNLAEDGITNINDEQAFEILLGGSGTGNHPNGYGNLEKVFLWLQSVDFLNESDELQREIKRQKFKDEFTKHFNMEYCRVYYIMTDLLIQYDSRGKNMMLASWGPLEEGGDYIWFPIFYDVDTQLGVNNSGVPLWDYNLEPSETEPKPTFSTANSILWTCFKDVFIDEIKQAYRDLRQGNLTIEKLLGYYNFEYSVSNSEAMNGILPMTIINADEYYKYIEPAITGYIPPEGGDPKKENGYYYCLQGTRELHREQFLRNRFNYYDSMWLAGSYNPSITTGTFLRINSYENQNDSTLNSVTTLTLTPKLDQYVVVWPDEKNANDGTVVPIKVQGGTSQTCDISDALGNGGYQQQIIYIGGKEYIQDYGDMSLLYLDEVDFQTTTLKSIILGNEDPDYINDKGTENFVLRLRAADQNEGGKPLLQTYDITNLSQANGTISLTTANKLTTFKALGTNITNALFAEGVALEKLYLPSSCNKIELIEAYNLNKIHYDYNDILDGNGKQNKNGLYIHNLIHHNDAYNIDITKLNSIKLIGNALDLYSYELLNKLTDAKVAIRNKSIEGYTDKLAIHFENVHWSPYINIGVGAIYDDEEAYYYAKTNCTYEVRNYDGNLPQWQKDVVEGKIYIYNSVLSNLIPQDLTMLDEYINDTTHTYFTNIYTEVNSQKLPVITGELFVNGTVNEYDIAHKYNVAFPDLVIRAATINEAYRACYVSENNGIETILLIDRYASSEDTIQLPDIDKLTIPQHYDFIGWKIKGDDSNTIYKTQEDFNDLEFVTNEIVFVLQIEPHKYNFVFKDGDGVEYDVLVEYNHYVTLPDIIPYKPEDANLLLEEVYQFKGWTNDINYYGLVDSDMVAESKKINITSMKATQDQKFYAMFVKDSVYNNVLDSSYFTIYNKNDEVIGSCANIIFNNKYTSLLKGKITIPSWVPDPNNPQLQIPVIQISGFKDASHITYCFFDKQKEILIKTIDQNCFENCYQLKYIDLPTSLQIIGYRAFYSCYYLSMNENDYNIKLEQNIRTIGEQAFSLGGLNTGALTTNIYIGHSVQNIGQGAFSNINRDIQNIFIGSINNPTQLLNLGEDVFKLNPGYGPYNTLTVYCRDNEHHTQLENILSPLYNANVINEFTYVWGNGSDTDSSNDIPNSD